MQTSTNVWRKSNAWSKSADPASWECDREADSNPWAPLTVNDDDGGDRTTEVDPEI